MLNFDDSYRRVKFIYPYANLPKNLVKLLFGCIKHMVFLRVFIPSPIQRLKFNEYCVLFAFTVAVEVGEYVVWFSHI